MSQSRDDRYLEILLRYLRVCASYRPKLGHGGKDGYTLREFRAIYRQDAFYSWLGLDNPLMYAAHKAAGGMTSIYRQIGMGCEVLFRQILQDNLGLDDDDVKWSYALPRADGTTRKLHLDARIPLARVADLTRRRRVRRWMREAAKRIDFDPSVSRSLHGVVFEIRQGYKSKDSKRQNADIANATTAYKKGLLPCAGILSLQIDEDIASRYRSEGWVLLTGLTGRASAHESFYSFCRLVIGYDLAAFFTRNSKTLKKELQSILVALLRPS